MQSMIPKARLLVVDDDHSVRGSLQKVLESEGYHVCTARDEAEALSIFAAEQIDLLIMDVNLDETDGWQTRRRLFQASSPVPSIIVTAELDQQGRAISEGAQALIEKPIDVDLFLQLVSELLTNEDRRLSGRSTRDESLCRYAARDHHKVVDLLNERHSASLELSDGLAAVLAACPPASASVSQFSDGSMNIRGETAPAYPPYI